MLERRYEVEAISAVVSRCGDDEVMIPEAESWHFEGKDRETPSNKSGGGRTDVDEEM